MFDLQKAISGAKLKTVSGIKVVHFWHKGKDENLVVTENNGVYWVDDNGRFHEKYAENSIILDNTETLWVVVAKVKGTYETAYWTSVTFTSLSEAQDNFPESKYTYHQITREVE